MSKLSSSLALADVDIISQNDAANNLILTNAIELPSDDQTMLDKLEFWAAEKPDADFLCEPQGDSWRAISYAQFLEQVRGLSAKLLTLGLNADKPLLLLSPNSIDNALVTFACMYVGIPVAPVSPAYGLMAKTFDRLQQIIEILQPGAIYVNDADLFARSVSSITDHYSFPIIDSVGRQPGVRALDSLERVAESQVAQARQNVTPDSVAKIMFTSGSTGVPKGVLNSHRMMYSNQLALTCVWPFLSAHPPRIVDWLPWSHTFGGNVCFNSVLFNGGVFYIDDGKPSPNLVGRTVANLKAGQPNLHYNVPAGIEALLTQLEADDDFS
jgi:feruloyl-CoA synthase